MVGRRLPFCGMCNRLLGADTSWRDIVRGMYETIVDVLISQEFWVAGKPSACLEMPIGCCTPW